MANEPTQLTRLLCVDTATPVESVALWVDGELAVERAVRRKRGHGPGLIDDIDGVLTDAGIALAEVEAFVCGLGPGSFTGLRIALATLKGLAMACGRPLYGARTTAALMAAMPGRRVVAALDARRGEIYVEGGGIEAPLCVAPDQLELPAGDAPVFLGEGARMYAAALCDAIPGATVPEDPALHIPRAALLARCVDLPAPPALATLEPVYIRRPDAEIHWPDGFPDAMGRLPSAQARAATEREE